MPKLKDLPAHKGFSPLKIFNYVGGTLIFLGITIFISLNWYALNDFLHIFVTLGAAIAAFVIGILLHLDRRHEEASSAFFMIAGLLLPIGIYVTLDIFGYHFEGSHGDLLITAICFCVFLLAHLYAPRTVLLLFCILFASLFFFSVIDFISVISGIFFIDVYSYALILLGFSYILFGRYLEDEKKYPLVGPLYFFGALFILTTSFCLSQSFWYNEGPLRWRILTALFIILAFVMSIPMRSKSFLYLGALFLIFYICDLSYRFASVLGNMGWPLLLIMAGLLLIFLGYFVVFLHQRISRRL